MASPLAPPPSPAGPPPLAIRDGAARDRDLGGDRLQNDTPPMLLGSPPLAPRDGSAMQPGGGQLEMDEMDEEGRTRHHARMCAAPLPLPPHPTAAVSRNEEAGLNRQPAPLRVGPSVRVLSTKDRVYLSKRPPQPSPGPSLRSRVFMLTLAPRSVPPPRPTGRLLGFVRDTSREIQPPLSRGPGCPSNITPAGA